MLFADFNLREKYFLKDHFLSLISRLSLIQLNTCDRNKQLDLRMQKWFSIYIKKDAHHKTVLSLHFRTFKLNVAKKKSL